MAEHRRRDDHARVIPAAENFYVGTAGERHPHANENVALGYRGNGYRLYLQVFLAVEHGRHHLIRHSLHLCGSRIIFNDWESGCNARSKAELASARGSRCETSKSTGISPENTRSADCFCRSTEAL